MGQSSMPNYLTLVSVRIYLSGSLGWMAPEVHSGESEELVWFFIKIFIKILDKILSKILKKILHKIFCWVVQ